MSQLTRAFKRIRLNLARSPEFPTGSTRHGYEFVAPLNEDDHIDPALWRRFREHCGVRRFWGDEAETGRLEHKAGGRGDAWIFDYDRTTDVDDEAGFRFGDHAFRPGEYVSVTDSEGELHTFRVVSVETAM